MIAIVHVINTNLKVIGGNIATASPISDLNPILVAVGTILYITSENSEFKCNENILIVDILHSSSICS